MMKPCALCRQPALLFCESDRASLCWDCDAKVHGANFLVARHTRCLLCRVCQEPTPWKASGSQLGRTVSVCERCANGRCDAAKGKLVAATVAASAAADDAAVAGVRGRVAAARTAPEVREEGGRSSSEEDDDDDDLDDEDDLVGEDDEEDDDVGTDYDDEYDSSDDEEEEGTGTLEHQPHEADDEDGDNQVVPWSIAAEGPAAAAATDPTPPPPTGSSSSSDDADCYPYAYESSSPARSRAMRRMMMAARAQRENQDDEFEGNGFAKRRMLARPNATNDLATTYHYQDDPDASPHRRPGHLRHSPAPPLPLYYSAGGAGHKANPFLPAKPDRKPDPAGDWPATNLH